MTNQKLFFWRPHANFQLWSQSLFLSKTFFDFQKMDKKKMSKIEKSKYFWENKFVKI